MNPDLHVAVVSSSAGAGAWTSVPGCSPGASPGDDQGLFQQGPGGSGAGMCTSLHAGETFLKTGDGTNSAAPNFNGDVGKTLQCMALLGGTGCGQQSPFKSVYYALQRGRLMAGPDDMTHDSHNGGFLRDDAVVAVVVLTNQDDCSVASNSLLMDPDVNSVVDPTGLGAFQSYRCNEFGHLCGGQPPPHGYDFTTSAFDLAAGTYRTALGAGTGGVVLQGCVSAEDMGKTDPLVTDASGSVDSTEGHLWPTVGQMTSFISSLKADPNKILVAALAGLVTDANGASLYHVFSQVNSLAKGRRIPWWTTPACNRSRTPRRRSTVIRRSASSSGRTASARTACCSRSARTTSRRRWRESLLAYETSCGPRACRPADGARSELVSRGELRPPQV